MAGVRKRYATAADSKSLWNYTESPGWDEYDARMLRLCIIRYGCGNWKSILNHFFKKTNNQLNGQTQRAFQQQAIAEYSKIHIDPWRIANEKNSIELRPNEKRKNGCIINTGDNMTKSKLNVLQKENYLKYGIEKIYWQRLQLPVLARRPRNVVGLKNKIYKLRELYRALYAMEQCYNKLTEVKNDNNIKNNNNNVVIMKNIGNGMSKIDKEKMRQEWKKNPIMKNGRKRKNSGKKMPKKKKIKLDDNKIDKNENNNDGDKKNGDDNVDMKDVKK